MIMIMMCAAVLSFLVPEPWLLPLQRTENPFCYQISSELEQDVGQELFRGDVSAVSCWEQVGMKYFF
jgi:hypothetical protein